MISNTPSLIFLVLRKGTLTLSTYLFVSFAFIATFISDRSFNNSGGAGGSVAEFESDRKQHIEILKARALVCLSNITDILQSEFLVP